jgi:protocatechuate 3,4-dioxygenase beta subunit
VDLAELQRMTRRRLLLWAGGLGLAALAPACADDSTSAGGTAETTTAGGTAADCVLMPELTEGPFYLDLDLVRGDITEGRPGTPLDLCVNVVDVDDSCAPIANGAVDVWHADAGGEYSGVQGSSGTFLRGIQMTDRDGRADFGTIYPGWYTGRAVHIHVKVHLGSNEVHTGQLFFDDDLTDTVYEAEPYAQRPNRDTLNSSDGIFSEGGGTTIVSVNSSGDGYTGSVTLGVQRA